MASGYLYQSGHMPRDQITLPAHQIPPACLCTWVSGGSGMRLKFTHCECQHDDDSVPWDYATWRR